jgi:hypothetical protein
MNRGQFVAGVLGALGAPVTKHSRRALQAQLQTEGGSAKYNPFNTTLKMPGSTDYNKVAPGIAVQNYISAEQGIAATVKTLHGTGHGYEKIIRRLRKNAFAIAICMAIVESDWGTGEAISEDDEDEPLIMVVLDEIRHNVDPNTLDKLEAKSIAS